MNICLFTSEEIGKPLPWNDGRAQHLIKVLHKKQGDSFAAGKALITKISEKSFIEFSFEPESSGKILYPLNMIIGFPRPIQLKRLLRDIAGLGASAVYLTGTELGEKSYLQSTLVERGAAYQMLLDGTVQAGSTHVPELFIHKNLAECMENLNHAEYAEKSVQPSQEQAVPSLKIALDNILLKLTFLKLAIIICHIVLRQQPQLAVNVAGQTKNALSLKNQALQDAAWVQEFCEPKVQQP